ncbi:DUF4259 domain-containing protein [Streptomyces sp. NPDC051452]|uniref:DUF4259 domain-containing protein n=1 Tax=Streptomyces sp. NPDC051452 TaxID=3365654 RepID=UPI00379D230B
MGTWGIGPFDNDTAADFAGDLDEALMEQREPMIRRVLKRAADPADYLWNEATGLRPGHDDGQPTLIHSPARSARPGLDLRGDLTHREPVPGGAGQGEDGVQARTD